MRDLGSFVVATMLTLASTTSWAQAPAFGEDDPTDGFGEVRWAQTPKTRGAAIPYIGASTGAALGGVLGGGAMLVTTFGVGVATRESGYAAIAGIGAGAATMFISTSALWPHEVTQRAPLEIGLGAVGGATVAGVIAAGVSVSYVSVVYADSDCRYCGADMLPVLLGPAAAAGIGAMVGANLMVARLDADTPPPPLPPEPAGPTLRDSMDRRPAGPPASPGTVVDDDDDDDGDDDVGDKAP
jgi:hypothetical protein